METIDVQSRSFVIRWIGGIQGDEIEYQVKPLKKSVKLEIYKKPRSSLLGHSCSSVHIAPDTKALLDYTIRSLSNRNTSSVLEGKNGSDSASSVQEPRKSLSLSNIQQQSQEMPLPERLVTSGFTLVKSVGMVAGNKRESGLLTVKDNDYYYAFVLDNTYSKNAKKKILFSAAVVRGDETRSARSLKFPQSPALSQDGFALSQQEIVLRVGQGRYLQGYLLKKRRKKLQGFKKRFFSLDYKYGTLFYYLNERNQTCRGEIVINISTVSANKKDKLIIIDSGMELWVLKARDIATWKIWVEALQCCFEQLYLEESPSKRKTGELNQISHPEGLQRCNSTRPSRINFSAEDDCSPLSDVNYEEFALHLNRLQQRVEQCRKESLSYTPRERDPKMQLVSRTSSSSSAEEKHKEPTWSASDSADSLGSVLNTSSGHPLYQKLCDVEMIVARFVQQNQVILKDHQQVTKQIKTHQSTSVSLFSNDEYFDASEDNEHGVIILDIDDTDENTNETSLSPMASDQKFGKRDKEAGQELQSPEKLSETYRYSSQDGPITHESTPEAQLPTFNVIDTSQTDETDHTTDEAFEKNLYPLPWKGPVERRNDVRAEATTPPSFLAFMRKNVGKDLSSIAMPVTANEPITILQALSEMLEYSNLLSTAAESDDISQRLKFVSAFAVSFLSIYRDKTRVLRKPFTPLLTETFELVREDVGYRLIAEKVSHKPLILAFHAEHAQWEFSYTVRPSQKFWGKSVELNNEGTVHLKLKATDETFEWAQPTTMLKNLLAGERYIEPINEFEIQSSSGGKATVAFKSAGMFGGRSEELKITIMSPKKKHELTGKWTEYLKEADSKHNIWEVNKLIPDCKKKYGFSMFTSNLNEITELEQGKLPPTDSRLRPDLRAYENGQIDEAERLKLKLEKDQRERRGRGEDLKPQYFKKLKNNEWQIINGSQNYWERRKRQDWSGITPLW